MSKFIITESNLGKFETIKVINNETNEFIEIAKLGATLIKFVVNVNGELIDIIDGFQTEEELEYSKGARSWIMCPFSNRIKDGIYSFDGKVQKIIPAPPRAIVIHGFTSIQNFEIHNEGHGENSATVEFINKTLRKGAFEGYPFDVDVLIRFTYSATKLTINVEGINVGDSPAPFGTGWHPYFKTSDSGIENLVLECEAESIIKTDSALIPLPLPDTYQKINKDSQLFFGKGQNKKINKTVFDVCFANMIHEKDKIIRTSIIDLDKKFKLTVFQEGGITLIFSGDTLQTRARNSLAIEPVQFMTDAFNRPELKDNITIFPGKKSIFTFGVELKTYES